MPLTLISLFLFAFSLAPLRATPIPENASEILIKIINQERATNHLPPLVSSPLLNQIASEWATHLASKQTLKHRSSTELIAFLKKYSWRRMNENLHAFPEASDPAVVVRSWMKSPVHRRNCLDPELTLAGAALILGADGKVYAVFNGAALGGARPPVGPS